jgi:hypothetical protein
MNNKNAVGFFLLGLLMYVTPVLAQSLASHPGAVTSGSVRMVWLEFMGWVVGGIGLAYLIREVAVRLPSWLPVLVPERVLRSVFGKAEPVQLPVGARVGVSN